MKLSYYNSNYNFGDLLNVTLLNDLFGVNNVVHESSIQKADMIAIGSLAERLIKTKPKQITIKKYLKRKYEIYTTPSIEVFGTGFIKEHDFAQIKSRRRLNIIALRGECTKNRIDLITKRKNKTTLGDPGLLCKELIDTTKIKKRFKLGIIPHYIDKKSKTVMNIHNNNPNSKIIDIQQEPYSFMKEISQCEMILSSAMHGLIAADSLNIPNLRLVVSDNLVGGNFKFHDYYSVFGIKNHKKIDFFNYKNCSTNMVARIEENFINKSNKIDKINHDLYNTFKKKSKYA
jgi:hypothetical protein